MHLLSEELIIFGLEFENLLSFVLGVGDFFHCALLLCLKHFHSVAKELYIFLNLLPNAFDLSIREVRVVQRLHYGTLIRDLISHKRILISFGLMLLRGEISQIISLLDNW